VLFKLDNFYCFTTKFNDSFHCLLYSSESNHCVFNSLTDVF
jgi:hypothetical protein